MDKSKPTTLYQFHNADGELIYVGITARSIARFTDHEHKAWWSEVARIDVRTFPDRDAAARVEAELIRAHLPRYNNCRIADSERDRRGQTQQPRQPWGSKSRKKTARRSWAKDTVPEIACEHAEPPFKVIAGQVHIEASDGPGISWPVRLFKYERKNGDGTMWVTRLEADGVWRTRLVSTPPPLPEWAEIHRAMPTFSGR